MPGTLKPPRAQLPMEPACRALLWAQKLSTGVRGPPLSSAPGARAGAGAYEVSQGGLHPLDAENLRGKHSGHTQHSRVRIYFPLSNEAGVDNVAGCGLSSPKGERQGGACRGTCLPAWEPRGERLLCRGVAQPRGACPAAPRRIRLLISL